jgi:hydrogenase maturation protease
VALGNPYRTDDGVGIALLRRLRVIRDASRATGEGTTCHASPVTRHEIELLEGVYDGLRLAEAIAGYEEVLVVDAAPWLPAGEVLRFDLGDLPARAGYLHGLGLRAALEALAMAGERVPTVEILAIGIPGDPPFGEGLSPAVEGALPVALEEAIRWLNE